MEHFRNPLIVLRGALLHLSPYLSQAVNRLAIPEMHFNSDDEAAMILRDAIFVLETVKEVSIDGLNKARKGRWRLKPQFREQFVAASCGMKGED